MMNKLNDYLQSISGKRILVLGIGVSNRPLVRLLLNHGLDVTACDKTPRENLDEEVLLLEEQGAKLKVGDDYLENLVGDVVFRTPGMRPDIPALLKLREQGAEITSEMEVFFKVCPCKIIAVTGSDGKTTTTTLISEILKQAGYKVWVGGNIGTPLLDKAGEMTEKDMVVVELSSFQLLTMQASAHVAVITNLAPNHLDMHKGMEEYVASKENVYLHQTAKDKLVVNLDNEITNAFAPKAKGRVEKFSRLQRVDCGSYLEGDTVYYKGNAVMTRADIRIPGLHNVENYMAAICATSDFVSLGDVVAVAGSFGGVEHRMELVRNYKGIRIYNDSIASSPSRTTAGLRSFNQKIILIAGGYDKKIPFESLGMEICDRVKALVLCGDTADQIRIAVENAPNYTKELPVCTVSNLDEALQKAVSFASEGDVIALSPACASFDQFKNFMVRGNYFKKIVMELE